MIRIVGTKEGIDKAVHEIQVISDIQVLCLIIIWLYLIEIYNYNYRGISKMY